MLGGIVIPTRLEESVTIRRNFRLWSYPGFAPLKDSTRTTVPLVFLFNNNRAKSAEQDILKAFAEYGMDRFFAGPDFIYLDLVGSRDLYLGNAGVGKEHVGADGAKAGPNNQFFAGMERCSRYGGFVFYMETDCVPIRPNWLTRVMEVAANSADSWVVGSIYRGIETLNYRIRRHINGNALYAVGDKSFQEFVLIWRDQTLRLISEGNTGLAYDCTIEYLATSLGSQTAQNDSSFLKKHAHKFRFSDFIQNISGPEDEFFSDESEVLRILQQDPGTVILHGKKFSAAADALLSSGLPVVAGNLLPKGSSKRASVDRLPNALVRAKRVSIRALYATAQWLETTEFSKIFKIVKPKE